MKLDEIVETKRYKTELAADAAWEMLNANCKHALKDLDQPIVRGMTTFDKGAGIIHGAAGARESANTMNYYTIILDAVLPKGYPKRSASIICGNWQNRMYASSYGTLHAIFPFDGVKIGVCPDDDIFAAEATLGTQTRRFSRWNNFYDDNGLSDESFQRFLGDFQLLLERKDLWGLEANTLRQEIAKAYSEPFKLATTGKSEIYNDGKAHEVWIGGKCVAIQLDVYNAMKAKHETA